MDERQPQEHDPEVADIARTLAGHGALTRAALEERVGAAHWEPGRFARALRRAIDRGHVREVGGDLYEAGEPHDTPTWSA